MPKATVTRPASRSRRAPPADERLRDAERSRRLLLGAALDVFAEKGFAGARVQEIAERAGVNKQLISYYFGGKEGLYKELQLTWRKREMEAEAAQPEMALDELVTRYLHEALADPRMMRLVVWSGLAEEKERPPDAGDATPGTSGMRQRRARGELAGDLEPDGVLLALMGAVAAPIVMPHLVRRMFGLEASDPRFERRYGTTLRLMVRHLAGRSDASSTVGDDEGADGTAPSAS